jgi:hypothetical protein
MSSGPAQVLLEAGQCWEAVQAASRAAQLRPGWPEAHLTLARAQLNFGEPQLALASYDSAIKLQVRPTAWWCSGRRSMLAVKHMRTGPCVHACCCNS